MKTHMFRFAIAIGGATAVLMVIGAPKFALR